MAWVILDTLLRPDLLSKAKEEITEALSNDEETSTAFDLTKLLSQPFLQSIYSEELRMRAGVAIQRVPVVDDFKIGPWKFPRGQMIVASSWHEHRDKKVWNEGPSNGVSHPVEEFWAERFLVYPNDPNSGPRRPDAKTKAKIRITEKTALSEDKPIFTIDPVQGSYVPYGGGLKMCPGRFYAKQEIFISTAIFLTFFDIEMTNKDLPQPNLAYFPFGVVPPLGKFPAKIRRRKAQSV